MKTNIRLALLGNPNTGKSTLFNELTGLNQKVGNFAGVTVEKKTGIIALPDNKTAEIVDLPGIYSLYSKSKDEQVAFQTLCSKDKCVRPDLVIIVIDASNIKRNLLLYSQVADLNIPIIVVLNMVDIAKEKGIKINTTKLAHNLGVRVIDIVARDSQGIDTLKNEIANTSLVPTQKQVFNNFFDIDLITDIKNYLNLNSNYEALQYLHQYNHLDISESQKDYIKNKLEEIKFEPVLLQAKEAIDRYNTINKIVEDSITYPITEKKSNSSKLDKILIHKHLGIPSFLFILFVLFQSIFHFAEYPMVWIEDLFANIQDFIIENFPEGPFIDLLANGIIAGIGGMLVFLPQITILFFFIAILEDTGYMARITFMMDKLMRNVGLNGKSIVPLISGIACAVPAVMATRTIENNKDRLITILVTPLMTCSARLPVYVLLISLFVPNEKVFAFINLQGLVLMLIYLLSFLFTIAISWLLKFWIKNDIKSYFIMELPTYKAPRWKHIGLQLLEKIKSFIFRAGQIIVSISIILWGLSNYSPNQQKIDELEIEYNNIISTLSDDVQKESIELERNAKVLEYSYAGYIGKFIEPVIKPLGYDWKIGIAVITSFAAREVFVGTMATIYSLENSEDEASLKEQLLRVKDPETGNPVFTIATAISLIIFYAFAMQCLGTVVTVYKETNSLKWTAIQWFYMSGLAYLGAFIAYNTLK